MPPGWNDWTFYDGVIAAALFVLLAIAAVDDWRAHRERERAFAQRMKRVLPEHRR